MEKYGTILQEKSFLKSCVFEKEFRGSVDQKARYLIYANIIVRRSILFSEKNPLISVTKLNDKPVAIRLCTLYGLGEK